MAPFVRYALNSTLRRCAIVFGGDERTRVPLPAGWEEVVPREAIPSEREFQKWLAQDSVARLLRLSPEGFRPIVPKDGSGWIYPDKLPR